MKGEVKMHYCGYIITNKIPTKEEIQEILEPYDESKYEDLEFSWDWYTIGGRYGAKLKIKFIPEETEEKWFGFKNRNYKYFISSEIEKLKDKEYFFEELDHLMYMGLRENILFVDGAYYKDIIDFDITETCFVIDDNRNLYSRELWRNHNYITDEKFDEKVKKIDLENKFITVIDLHD